MPYNPCNLPEYPLECDMWDKLARENRPIIVYGMGNGADKLIERLSKYNVTISDFFASDGFVRGHSFHGKRVKSFSEIKAEYSDFVILVSFGSSRDEVIELFLSLDREYELYIPDMPVCEAEYFDRELYNSSYSDIKMAYDTFADEQSRNAFASIVNFKLTGKLSYLLGAYSTKSEMYSLISKKCIKSYVDAGAYNGDTLKEAIENFKFLEGAILIEPDPKNFKKLSKLIPTIDRVHIEAINSGAWCECRAGEFSVSGNRNSSVSATRSYENKSEEISLITIDSAVNFPVDYIKYDVEGAELEALIGSAETIEKCHPVLLISLYHKSRDLFSLVNFMKEKYKGKYDFYLRRLKSVPAWDINLILIPRS